MSTAQIRINTTLPGYGVAGDVVTVMTDHRGTVMNRFWRRRLRDAKHDGCCELIADVEETAPEPEYACALKEE